MDIPTEVNLSDTLYGISMYTANVFTTFVFLFAYGVFDMDHMFGLIYMIPVFVAQVLSQLEPQKFYYVWDGWYDVLKIVGSIMYIWAFLWMFKLGDNQAIRVYYFIGLIVLYLYVIPTILIPYSIGWLDVFEMNYMLRDLLFPSLLSTVSLIGLSVAAKNVIYTVR